MEGQTGEIRVLAITSEDPRKAMEFKMQLRPLSLHEIVHALDQAVLVDVQSTLVISGAFSADRAYRWVIGLLQNVPAHRSGLSSLCFKNTLIGTGLTVRFSDGEISYSHKRLYTSDFLVVFSHSEL